MKMIEAGGIDIVGHMDKIYMNGQKYKIFNFEEDWYPGSLLRLVWIGLRRKD